MTNMSLLKSKIIENGLSVEKIVESIRINKSTFNRKLANKGENFTVEEVYKIASSLNLSAMEVNAIFFNICVA